MIKLAVPTPKKGWSQPEHIQYWGVPYVLLLVVWMRLVVASVVVLIGFNENLMIELILALKMIHL